MKTKVILSLLTIAAIATTMTSCKPDRPVGSVSVLIYESDVRDMEKAMEKAQADVKAELEKLSK